MPSLRAPVASFKVRVPDGAYDKVMAAMVSAVAAMLGGRADDPEAVAQLARSLLLNILAQMREVHNSGEENGFPQPVDWQDVPANWRAAYQEIYIALFKQTYSGVAIAYAEQHIGLEKWLVVLDAKH